MRSPLVVVLLVLCLLLPAGTATGATYDPQLTWRTIVTEHFRIHFHQGLERIADDLTVEAERIYETMSTELDWRARMKVDVVLVDLTDRANGFASVVPYNAITIFVTAPQEDATLSLYEDWTQAIFTHELTHVLHLETNEGIVRAARFVVGRIASTNDVSPLWMIEGLATFQETRHTAGGRGRSPYVDMIERTSVVYDAFPTLGNLDGIQAAYPSANLRYLFGEDFIRYVMERTGENAWTRWTHAYGRHIPWILPTKKVFGRKLQGLYRQWRADTTAEYLGQVARIEQEGVREGIRLSQDDASCTAPSFSPTGTGLVWSCYALDTGSSLWMADEDGTNLRRLRQDVGAKTFTWRRDGEAFVYAGNHIVNRFNTWSDVYLYDLQANSIRSLTRGARARDPDFSPDGKELMVVTNAAQDTQLEVLTVDQRRTRLTNDTDHVQYATPRYAPSGEVLAVSIWDQGRRDLWLVSPTGQRLRRLTADVALDRDPAWSSDGSLLFFSSERSGVPNVYAIDIATESLFQVTNVRTGAARPTVSPDGRRLAYEQYTQDGWEVRLMALDRTQWIPRGALAASLTDDRPLAALVQPGVRVAVDSVAAASWIGGQAAEPDPIGTRPVRRAQDPGPGIDSYDQIRVDDAFDDEDDDYPFRITPRRYSPAHAMVPRYWFPGFSVLPLLPGRPRNPISQAFASLPTNFQIGGFSFSASTGASDPVAHVRYGASLRYRSDIDGWDGGASVTINKLLPVFQLAASTTLNPFTYLTTGPYQPIDEDGDLVFTNADLRSVFMRSVTGSFAVSYPFTPRSTFFASYAFSWRDLAEGLDPDVYLPSLALRGTLGNLTAGYQYAWGQPTATAIAPEDARSVVVTATLTAPFLGTFAQEPDGSSTGVTQLLLSADWREYLVNPLAPNHVFVLHGGAGAAFGGEQRFLGNFQLGGNTLGAARGIRGYPFGADRGDSYWIVGAEYRLPLWRIDKGVGGTVPLFFRYLALNLFAEAGNAFDTLRNVEDLFDDALVGVGAELTLAAFVLWSGTLDVRLGYGVGLTQDGYFFDEPNTVYFLLSSSL